MEFFLGEMFTVYVFIFFANIEINEGYNATCEPPPICCISSHSNKYNQTLCTECLPGYHGPDCSLSCRYPNYGKGCQSGCTCPKENCHHIKGCEQKTCSKGYSGSNCNSTCQFPSYGADCKFNCSCEEQYCNFITGCTTLGLLNDESTWSKMKTSHKAMLVSICIIGTIFFIFLLIIFVLYKKKNVVTSYYHR